MATIFEEINVNSVMNSAPLAVRVRPQKLEELIGQEHVLGKNSWLNKAILADKLPSIILYGPAGTGKTTIAKIIANTSKADFKEVSAVSGKVSDIRNVIKKAKENLYSFYKKTILFIDEVHRFNKSQQDALLHAVENRTVTLIAATTENPYFEINSALISRCRIVQLNSLNDDNIRQIIYRALAHLKGFNNKFEIEKSALDAIVLASNGDARMALTTLELASEACSFECIDKESNASFLIKLEHVHEISQNKVMPYDKNMDLHYDIISAFIKSMRGSDANAALYWLARMIEGGEDPKFIARRIMILASEDIGNADPQAFLVAYAAFKAAEVIGYPECGINLAQAASYMALAPKSNAVVNGISAALTEVRNGKICHVPNHLRDRHRPGAEKYGDYKYPHDFPDGWVKQQYLPKGLEDVKFYKPGSRGWEAYRNEILQRRKNE